MKNRGQAFLELLAVIPVFILFLIGISYFGRIYITKIVVSQTAQYGLFLIIHKNYDNGRVTAAVIKQLSDKNMIPGFNQKNVTINVDLGLNWDSAAKVEIKYKLYPPNLLKKIPGFPNPLTIRGYSECYNDTWYLGYPNNLSKS